MYFFLTVLRYISLSYGFVQRKWNAYWFTNLRPTKQYYLSDDHTKFDVSDTRVPEDCVYIEEWTDENGHKKCAVRYEGDDIPSIWKESPFRRHAKCPWIWVGDRETEIDLTKTFNKFLVVGNVINLDLVLKLILITERTNLIYIESGTFNEIKFPGDGITIREYVD